MRIESLEQFISSIKEVDQCEEGYVRFYRGQPVNKPLIPNAFREQCFIDNESEIYNEIINKKPEEFSTCKCTFDYLVKMQHYNIPTRLLDITSNPLIALYFACSENPNEPTVYCLDIPTSLIKNYNSDSVTILSSLARYDKDSKENLIIKNENLYLIRGVFIQHIGKIADEIKKKDHMLFMKNKNLIATDVATKITNSLIRRKKRIIRAFIDSRYKDNSEFIRDVENMLYEIHSGKQNKSPEMVINDRIWQIFDMRLLHEVKQDKPYFLDLMHIDTFNTIYCVKPRLDNPRIIKQNGAFLIFPHSKAKLENFVKIKEIFIDKSKASSIVDELSIVDVNKGSLFNDMDTVCLAIKDKYKKQNN